MPPSGAGRGQRAACIHQRGAGGGLHHACPLPSGRRARPSCRRGHHRAAGQGMATIRRQGVDTMPPGIHQAHAVATIRRRAWPPCRRASISGQSIRARRAAHPARAVAITPAASMQRPCSAWRGHHQAAGHGLHHACRFHRQSVRGGQHARRFHPALAVAGAPGHRAGVATIVQAWPPSGRRGHHRAGVATIGQRGKAWPPSGGKAWTPCPPGIHPAGARRKACRTLAAAVHQVAGGGLHQACPASIRRGAGGGQHAAGHSSARRRAWPASGGGAWLASRLPASIRRAQAVAITPPGIHQRARPAIVQAVASIRRKACRTLAAAVHQVAGGGLHPSAGRKRWQHARRFHPAQAVAGMPPASGRGARPPCPPSFHHRAEHPARGKACRHQVQAVASVPPASISGAQAVAITPPGIHQRGARDGHHARRFHAARHAGQGMATIRRQGVAITPAASMQRPCGSHGHHQARAVATMRPRVHQRAEHQGKACRHQERAWPPGAGRGRHTACTWARGAATMPAASMQRQGVQGSGARCAYMPYYSYIKSFSENTAYFQYNVLTANV